MGTPGILIDEGLPNDAVGPGPVPTGFSRLTGGVHYRAEAWDDAQATFVDVTGSSDSEAAFSRLVAVRLSALAGLTHFSLAVLVQAPVFEDSAVAGSDLSVSVSVPQITWSVLHSPLCCRTGLLHSHGTSGLAFEESFGDITFSGVQFSLWQASAEGMGLSVSVSRAGLNLYDMSTLSLVQVIPLEGNGAKFHMITRSSKQPSSVCLRLPSSCRAPQSTRVPVIDLSFGTWRAMLPPWAPSRIAHLGQSLARAGSIDMSGMGGIATGALRPPRRLPVVVENALPVPVVFRQHGAAADEALVVQPGAERGYAWRHLGEAARALTFRLGGGVAWSDPLALEGPAVDGEPLWAGLDLCEPRPDGGGAARRVHVCVQRPSRAQFTVTLLPPLMLISHLDRAVEFAAAGVESSSNGVLRSRRFLEGLPAGERFRQQPCQQERCTARLGAERPAPPDGAPPTALQPGELVGLLPAAGAGSCAVSVRAPGEPFGPQLPLGIGEDLGAVARREERGAGAAGAARLEGGLRGTPRPASEAGLPGVLHLWPLLVFQNSCGFACMLAVAPLGTVSAGPGEERVLETAGDPRQMKGLELYALPGGHGAARSSGPLLLRGLAQFPHDEGDEQVAWRNSVCCKGPEEQLGTGVQLLVEVRHCRLSGLLRSLAVEPMWSFRNETGADVFVSVPGCPDVLHAAPVGDSVSAILGAAQHDPSFPFMAIFGVASGDGAGPLAWSARAHRCAMTKTTRVEVPHGDRCFVMLVSVSWRRSAPGQVSGGGVHVCLFAAAYVRSTVRADLRLSVGKDSDTALYLPAAKPPEAASVTLPWPWWPSEEAGVLAVLGDGQQASGSDGESQTPSKSPHASPSKQLALKASLSLSLSSGAAVSGGCGTEVSLDVTPSPTPLGMDRAAAVNSLAELLSPTVGVRACSGHVCDACVELMGDPQASMLLNLSYFAPLQGALVISLLRTAQPPLICVNLSMQTAWVSEPWRGTSMPQPPRWRRLPPGASLEVPCMAMRTLEVFPQGGKEHQQADSVDDDAGGSQLEDPAAPRAPVAKELADGIEPVQARLTVDPEAVEPAHMDFLLTADADLRWEPFGFPQLDVAVRSASGVCRVELRSPSGETSQPEAAATVARPPLRAAQMPSSLELTLRVVDLVVHLGLEKGDGLGVSSAASSAVDGRSLALHAQGVLLHQQSEAESAAMPPGRGRASRTRMALEWRCLSVADVGRPFHHSPLKQVLAIPPCGLELALYHPPYGLPVAYERVQVTFEPGELEECPMIFCIDDSLLQFAQLLGAAVASELQVDAAEAGARGQSAASTPGSRRAPRCGCPELPPVQQDEFGYLCFEWLSVPALPLCVDLRLSSPVFVSFTGLMLTFPEVQLSQVVTTGVVLSQEMIAHCIAFGLLNIFSSSVRAPGVLRPAGEPRAGLQAPAHGLGRPPQEAAARGHVVVRLPLFIRKVALAGRQCARAPPACRNLPAAGPGPSAGTAPALASSAPADAGLAAGMRALVDGLSRGLGGVVRWEQHTPERAGALGLLRGARNAVAGAVAHPVGGMLDLLTATARGWSTREASVAPAGGHPAACAACLGHWKVRLEPDVSPLKFHLHCCQGPLAQAGSVTQKSGQGATSSDPRHATS
ncbi:unnamed protein product [Prorocentrum cordatum]|uniref:Vacuolar protein sorting-associated protein 13 VPS13 adaptor binding domain-containing protein n=1 Tax=Prorocentrum cordatum TaxID=2364126 RepID=A0ABN9X6P7_9DINO|nr:unnamed protein product [Polarella glacialis]